MHVFSNMYEILGRQHLVLARKEVASKDLENIKSQWVLAEIYVGLTDDLNPVTMSMVILSIRWHTESTWVSYYISKSLHKNNVCIETIHEMKPYTFIFVYLVYI